MRLSSALLLIALAPAPFSFVAEAAEAAEAGDAHAKAPVETWVMPAEQIKAIDELLDRAVALGIPDGRGAVFFVGPLKITPPEAKDGENSRNQAAELAMYSQVHARLADGRWMIGLSTVVTAADGTVDPSGAKEVPAAELLAAVKAQLATQVDQVDGHLEEFLGMMQEADRPRVRAGLDYLPLLMAMGAGDAGSAGVAIAVLERGGVPSVERALPLIMAAIPTFGGMWKPRPLMSRGRRMMDGKPEPVSVPKETAWLGDGFSSRLLAQADRSKDPEEIKKLRDGVLALVDAADLATAKVQIAMRATRAALPPKPDPAANLPARVASWSGGRLSPQDEQEFEMPDEGMSETTETTELSEVQVTTTDPTAAAATDATDAKPKPVIRDTDLDGLFALLADDHASRWMEYGLVRSVGDNALRAISQLLGVDPRVCIGRDIEAVWTDEERKADASALQTWWAAQKGKKLPVLRQELLTIMPLQSAAAVISNAKPDERAALLDAIAKHWETHPPGAADQQALVAILRLADKHEGIAARMKALPLKGPLRVVLVAWRAKSGDMQAFDELLEEVCKRPHIEDAELPELSTTMSLLMHLPSQAHAQRELALVSGTLDGQLAPAAIGALGGGDYDMSGALTLVSENSWSSDQDQGQAGRAVRSYGLYALLVDKRPIPAAWVNTAGKMIQVGNQLLPLESMEFDQATRQPKKPDPRPFATDLRICDLASLMIMQQRWVFGFEQDAAGVDLHADAAARDTQLDALRATMADKVRADLAAAKLSEPLPGDAGAKDPKSLF